MPIDAEFEEKEYEIPLYFELYDRAHLWTPGQVLEARLGTDAVLRTESQALWRRLGYAHPLQGLPVRDLGDEFTRPGRRVPDFSANLFLQAKRPVELRRRPRGVTATALPGSRPYWRFAARERQHDVLTKLGARVGNRALVVYASPAFADLDTLYDCIDKRQLMERSTFIRVDRLGSHRRWVYSGGGTCGVGCSTPEPIEEPPFLRQLDLFRSRAMESGAVPPLMELAGTIERIIRSEDGPEDPRGRALLRRHRLIDELVERPTPGNARGVAGDEAGALLNPFARVYAFAQVFGLDWFVLELAH
jgi:hypothetical protein